MDRRLVRFGLIDPDAFRAEVSDGTVWLHRVERDEQGHPIPGQINRWLNLISKPPGMNAVLNDTEAPPRNCSQSREPRVDRRSGRTDKCVWPR
jgi:hypothetical protein